jgi:hypothetical protein
MLSTPHPSLPRNGVLLEAQHDDAVEEVAREHAVPGLRDGRSLNRYIASPWRSR